MIRLIAWDFSRQGAVYRRPIASVAMLGSFVGFAVTMAISMGTPETLATRGNDWLSLAQVLALLLGITAGLALPVVIVLQGSWVLWMRRDEMHNMRLVGAASAQVAAWFAAQMAAWVAMASASAFVIDSIAVTVGRLGVSAVYPNLPVYDWMGALRFWLVAALGLVVLSAVVGIGGAYVSGLTWRRGNRGAGQRRDSLQAA
jgi:hypothetical protein